MQIASTIASVRSACANLRARGVAPATLGLVPTMGALHEGHLSLVRASRAQCDITAVSIFVNPTQFGPTEDLARYPRTWEADCQLLEAEGVDLIFAPDASEMYPTGGLRTFVEVPGIGDRLDGRSRPGHFRGVATVVSKLLHIISPDVAFFGQKDAAQVAVLRAMVRDLNLPVRMSICPTVREPDGLAMSSRNRYLTPSERQHALALYAGLREIARSDPSDPAALQQRLHGHLAAAPGLHLDYAEIVDPDTLEPVGDLRNGALVAVAAWVGATRLIDNILLPSATAKDPQ